MVQFNQETKDMLARILSGPVAEFLQTYKIAIAVAIAVIYITIIIILVLNIARLSVISSHPIQRRQAIINLLIAFTCLALVSCFTIVYMLILRLTIGAV